MTPPRGFTLIEVIVATMVVAILASAFIVLTVPQINLFFFLPQRVRMQNTAYELLDIILEGDAQARGLRYAGPLAAQANGIIDQGGNPTDEDTLIYTYREFSLTANGFANHTIIIQYDAGSGTVTRSIDGGTPRTIPYHATAASGTKIEPLETDFFRYYNSAGAELTGGAIVPANIYRVDIPILVSSGSGKVTESEGQISMKSGAEIKNYST